MATCYQEGSGGKVRRNHFKKLEPKPYDRPPLGLARNPTWVSKIIFDPASKLVTAGADFFLSSFFRKRLAPPPPPSGSNQASRDTFQETVVLSSTGDQRLTVNDRVNQCSHENQGLEIKDPGKTKTTTDNGGLSELELMLKQKTFTRSEFDHLTELLHSRTVESSNGDREKCTDFRIQETLSASRGQDSLARSSLQGTRNESHLFNHRFPGRVPTAVASSEVLEDDAATPAELAKAYMGSRTSKVSPSVLGLRSQAVREDSGALCNSPFATRSPVMPLVQKPSIHGGVLENGFMTPRSRGRSAIYSMARTPYSRNHPTASHKGNGSIYDGYGGPSASPSTGFSRELVSRSVSKDMALKRRSSVLEDEIGSVGPIRRLRQKTNLSTPKNTSLPIARTPFSSRGTGMATSGTLDPSSSSKNSQGSVDNGNRPGTSYTPVPSQSKETARKILEQLEKLTSKEKQDRIGALSENSPSKLMPNMLQQALRSLDDVDSSKILQGAGHSLNSMGKGILPDACETSSSQRQDKPEENGQKSCNISHGNLAPAGSCNGTVVFKDTVPSFSLSDSVKKQVGAQSFQKKWAFQISAQEDILELDSEIHCGEAPASTKLAERKKILETTAVDSRAVPVREEKTTFVSEATLPFDFGKPTDLGTHDGTKAVEKSTDFMFSTASAASTSFLPVVSVSQSKTITENVPDKEPKAPLPLFSFGTKNDDNVPPFSIPSPPSVSGSLGLKSTDSTEAKQDTTNSLFANASNATETVPKPAESINSGVDNTQKPEDTVGKPENTFSLPQSPSASTSSVFTFGSNPSFSSVSNGFLDSATPSIFSGNQTLPNPFTSLPFSTTNSTVIFSEATPSTSATSSSLLAPAFKFGLASNSTPSTTTTPLLVAPSTYSTVSATSSVTTDVKVANGKETSIGNLPSNPFSAQSFPMSGTANTVFGFSAGSTSSSTAASIDTSISSQRVSVSASFPPSSTSGSTTFTFGSSQSCSSITSSPALVNTSSSTFAFGNNSTSSSTLFSSSTPSSSPFGLSNLKPSSTVFSFSAQSPASGNHGDQNTMAEDSMAEDVVQVAPTPTLTNPTPSFPVFGQLPVSNPSPSAFMFASTLPSSSTGVNPLQFGIQHNQPGAQNPNPFGQQSQPGIQNPNPFGQQSQTGIQNPNPFGQQSQSSLQNPNPFGQQSQPSLQNPNPFGQQSQAGVQNPNPFQASGSQDLGGGGSFSLGSGGGEKPGRRFVRVKRRNGK